MADLAKTNGHQVTERALESVLIGGDLSQLSPKDRTAYYMKVCETLGINPLTKPFEYLKLNGKTLLYATRNCTDQLRSLRKVSTCISGREQVGDVYIVTAQASLPDGRRDESVGVVAMGNLKGEALANAIMKAETKAKRRVTLSICGLSMMDELELETVPAAQRLDNEPAPQPVQATTARRDSTPPASGEEPVFRFGKLKGQPLTSAPLKDLEWYGNAIQASIDDPKKERFRDQNERHLDEVRQAYGAVNKRNRDEPPVDPEPLPDHYDGAAEAEAEAMAAQWES